MGGHPKRTRLGREIQHTEERARKKEIEPLSAGGGSFPYFFCGGSGTSWAYDSASGYWFMELDTGKLEATAGWTLSDPRGLGINTQVAPPEPGIYAWGWHASVDCSGVSASNKFPQAVNLVCDASGGVTWAFNGWLNPKDTFAGSYPDNIAGEAGGAFTIPMLMDWSSGSEQDDWYQGLAAGILTTSPGAGGGVTKHGYHPLFWARKVA